jgi:hypothetical protein
MATPTYVPLGTITLPSNSSSVTFSSIPATYRDLIIVINGTLSADSSVHVYYNGDTAANYTRVFMEGNGSTTGSGAGTDSRIIDMRNTSSNTILQIFDYAQTNKHKTALVRSNAPVDNFPQVWAAAGRWANTNAINTVALDPDSTTQFASGTTVSLYGIA